MRLKTMPPAGALRLRDGAGPCASAGWWGAEVGTPIPPAVDPGRAEQTRHRACSTVCGSTADGMGVGVSSGSGSINS